MTASRRPSNLAPATESLDDPVEQLVAECLERLAAEGPEVVDELCNRHPDRAAKLRERLDRLQRAGLMGDSPEANSARFPRRFGTHTLLHELGRGGMGVVYLARDDRLGRGVALKMLPASIGVRDRDLERFRREIRALASLEHPGIVRIYEGDVIDGIAYFTMERVDGRSLARAIRELRELGGPAAEVSPQHIAQALFADGASACDSLGRSHVESACRILIAAAEALQHAHEHGVLHRDVKPSNILIDRTGAIRLIDFGLARVDGEDGLTMTGDFLGTPSYMPPEQIEGRPTIDSRADVYSLGVVLYELLTLSTPFDASTSHLTAHRAVHEEPRPPRRLNPRLPRDLETICLTALEKAPVKRYASAAEMALDLRRFLEYRPIRARAVGPLARGLRFVRRRPALAASIVSSATLVLGAPSVIAFRETRAAERIRDEAQRTERLLDFVLDGLGAADPLSRQRAPAGSELTLREWLDRTAVGLDGLLGTDLAIRTKVRTQLARAYRGVGANDRALELLDSELELLMREGRAEIAECATIEHEIGVTKREQRDYDSATAWLEAAGDARTRLLGPRDAAVAETLHELGWTRWLRDYGRQDQVRELFEEALSIRRELFGDGALIVAETKAALATFRRNVDASSSEELETALCASVEALGDDHPRTAYLRAVLGRSERLLGRLTRAEQHLEHAVDALTTRLGPMHPHTRYALHELHDAYLARGRYRDAEVRLRESMAIADPIPGDVPPVDPFNVWELANVLAKQQRFDEAEALMQWVLELSAIATDGALTDLQGIHQTIARIRSARGLKEDAADHFEKALQISIPAHGAESRVVAGHFVLLANARRELGDWDASERLLHRAIDLALRIEGRTGFGTSAGAFVDALESLASLRMEVGRVSDAESLLRESLRYREKATMPGHWKTSRTKVLLGACLARLGCCDDALALASEGVREMKRELVLTHEEMQHASALLESVRSQCASLRGVPAAVGVIR